MTDLMNRPMNRQMKNTLTLSPLNKKTSPARVLMFLWLSACLAGCAGQVESPRPTVQLAEYELATGTGLQPIEASLQQPQSAWWQGYGSAELSQLMGRLAHQNFDLATATARVAQARALLGQQQAEHWPSLDVQVGARNSRDLKTDKSQNSSGLDFNASYEVDLWGSRRAADQGARLSVMARQQEYQSLLLQLQATLAKSYFEWLALGERRALAQKNFQASKDLLALIQLRFEAGSASGIELNQQRNTWLATRAQLFELERALLNRERALAVLVGQQSLTLPVLLGHFSDLQLPSVNPVQPAALLEYRPDIQLAEFQWRLSETALYQEKKKRWPQLTLSAGLGLDDVLSGGESWLASVAGSVIAPLFDAGRIRHQIAAAEVALSITELSYRQTVLTAMQDALETLSELSHQQRLLTVRQQELASNQQLYQLARLRYDSGDTDFINLLAAQRSWFSAQDSLIQTKNNQLLASVNVFRAMGVAPKLIH